MDHQSLTKFVSWTAASLAFISAAFWLWSAKVRVPDFRDRASDGAVIATDGDRAWDALEGLRTGAQLSALAAFFAALAAVAQGISLVI